MKYKRKNFSIKKLDKTLKSAIPFLALVGGNAFASTRNFSSSLNGQKNKRNAVVYVNSSTNKTTQTTLSETPNQAEKDIVKQGKRSAFGVFTNKQNKKVKAATINVDNQALAFLKANDLLASKESVSARLSGNTLGRKTFVDFCLNVDATGQAKIPTASNTGNQTSIILDHFSKTSCTGGGNIWHYTSNGFCTGFPNFPDVCVGSGYEWKSFNVNSTVAGGGGGDTSPPNFTNSTPLVSSTGVTQTTLTVELDEVATAYYVVVASGDTAPSVAQVQAGQNSSGTAAIKSASFTVNAATNFTADALISGLTAGTSYDIYVVAQDNVPNLQASVTLVSFTTATPDSDGDLTSAAGVNEPISLTIADNTVGEAVDLFDFTISDGGTADGLSLEVFQVIVNVTGTSDDFERDKITWRLNGTGVSNVIGTYNAGADTITFGGLGLSVADGASEVYTVNGYYNDITGLTDGNTIILSVNGDTDLSLNDGTIFGATSAVTNSTGLIIADGVAPTVISVNVPTNATYTAGANLDFTVNTDQIVNVTNTPRLTLTIGGSTKYATYLSGSGTNALTFRYTVQTGLLDLDGIALAAAIDLNSGTIRDGANDDINTTLNSVGALTGVLVNAPLPNSSPDADDDTANIDEDNSTDINVLANDSDSDGSLISSSVSVISAPSNGSATANNDGTITYTPTTDFNGSDSFTYRVRDNDNALSNTATVSVTVNPINDAPTGNVTISGEAKEYSTLTADTTAVIDTDGLGTFSYQWLSNGIEIDDAVSLSYTIIQEDIGHTLSVKVSYTDDGGTQETLTSASTSAVKNTNDAPVVEDTSASGKEDTSLEITLNVTDPDAGDNHTFSIVQQPSNGSAAVLDNKVTYTPTNNYFGEDSFTYKANDGELDSNTATVTITLTDVNELPEGNVTISGDTTEGETLTADTSTITDEDGIGTFGYQWLRNDEPIMGATDGTYTTVDEDAGQAISVIVSYTDQKDTEEHITSTAVTIVNVDDDAIIADQSIITDEDTEITFKPASYDPDPDDKVTYSITTTSVNGTVTITENNEFKYVPKENYHGTDQFTYTLLDANGQDIGTAKVSITINSIFDLSVAVDDSYELSFEDFSYTIDGDYYFSLYGRKVIKLNVSDNDILGDGTNAGTIQSVTSTEGNVRISSDRKSIIYQTEFIFQNTSDITITYTIDDGNNDTSTASVAITFKDGVIITSEPIPATSLSAKSLENNLVRAPYDTRGPAYDSRGENNVFINRPNVELTLTDIKSGKQQTMSAKTYLRKIYRNLAPGEHTIEWELLDYDEINSQVYRLNKNFYSYFTSLFYNMAFPQTITLKSIATVVGGSISNSVYNATVKPGSNTVTFMLSNKASDYPLEIPYYIDGVDSDLSELKSGVITINEGQYGKLNFNVDTCENFNNAQNSNSGILIQLGEVSGYTWEANQLLLTCNDATNLNTNLKSSITIDNQPTSQIIASQLNMAQFELSSASFYSIFDIGYKNVFSWSIDGITQEEALTRFTPPCQSDYIGLNCFHKNYRMKTSALSEFNLTPGLHKIEATWERYNGYSDSENTLVKSSSTSMSFFVLEDVSSLTNKDTDNDGIPDDVEGHGDNDSDGIPNYLDAYDQPQNQHVMETEDGSKTTVRSQVGTKVQQGDTAFGQKKNGTQLDNGSLPTDQSNKFEHGINDFKISLPSNMSIVNIILDQGKPIPPKGAYRKYTKENGWQDFKNDANNQVYSANYILGTCPPYTSDSWKEGIVAGTKCVRLKIEDGGPNDDDGEVNGVITDPGGIAVPESDNHNPIAEDDTASMKFNTSTIINVLENDTDIDADNLTLLSATANFGVIEIEDNKIRYTPIDDFEGVDTLDYIIVDDNDGIANAVVEVQVLGNEPPTIENEVASTNDLDSLIIDVLTNDFDPDGEALTLLDAFADWGDVSINADQSITYVPLQGYEGEDIVSYIVEDEQGYIARGIITLTLSLNLQPVSVQDTAKTNPESTITINVLANDNDPEGKTLTVLSASANHGSVQVNSSGTINYSAASGYIGTDTITYMVTDGQTDPVEGSVLVSIDKAVIESSSSGGSGGSMGSIGLILIALIGLTRRQQVKKIVGEKS